MSAAPQTKDVRRPKRSDSSQTKVPQATTLTAPKMPVSSRSRFPAVPTMEPKYCGPKYAKAVAPVACCAVKMRKDVEMSLKLCGCRSSADECVSTYHRVETHTI